MKELIDKLQNEGFKGFMTVGQLMANTKVVNEGRGVYLVLYAGEDTPQFLAKGTGGRFNDKDPNVGIPKLEANWICGEHVVYIGKGNDLSKRLSQYMRFGQGNKVGHWGGRFIWQLKDSKDLIVCWKPTDVDPRVVESNMIQDFKESHQGRRPFANLQD